LLAYALAEAGRWAEAFDAIEQGRHRRYPDGRFAGVRGLLREDASLIAAGWLAATADTDADAHAAAETRLHLARVRPATGPSLRLVAGWETDATDVDLVVAAEARRRGRRLADVRTGFGPEAWVSRGPRHASSVTATVHYYERGAMGHAFGAVQAIVHDGEGHLRFDTRPFVLQTGGGAVDLGRFEV
jgi:hypothetical protein